MRVLTINYDYEDDFAIVAPVKRCNLERFNHLLVFLHSTWSDNNYVFCDKCRLIMQRIVAYLPRIDIYDCGFDLSKLNTQSLESLFIGVIENGQMQKCKLLALHDYEVKTRPAKSLGESLTPADVPIPSSGLNHADLIASLIGLDESVPGAMMLYNNFDGEEINAIISQVNELRRDPQERLNEYLKGQFNTWKTENKQAYKDAIFS